MDRVAKASAAERQQLFSETARRMGVHPAIVEKDFWVCWILGRIFHAPDLSQRLMFKGGTSLSKAFGLIERFSEDIDLVLDWALVSNGDPMAPGRSNSAQAKLNGCISVSAEEYIERVLLGEITQLLAPLSHLTYEGNQTIAAEYPAAFGLEYLRPCVLLEIGPLAAWQPHVSCEIEPFAAHHFPDLFTEKVARVETIKAERTFWEKATILHHEANRPLESPLPPRYSRHYYDLALMAGKPLAERAIADTELLADVVRFKQTFYPRGWARYDLAVRGSLRLVPPPERWERLEKDYAAMGVMIFGTPPPFSEIMGALGELEGRINANC